METKIIDAQNVRDCHSIAAEINILTEQGQQMALHYIVEIGRRLKEAKALLPHGEWGDWLREEVSYSQSTAENFMRIASEYGDAQTSFFKTAKSQAIENLGYTKLVALLSVPLADREAFAERVDAEHLSTRELQDKIKELQGENAQALSDKENLMQVMEKQEKDNRMLKECLVREKETAESQTVQAEEKVSRLRKELEQVRREASEPSEDVMQEIRAAATKEAEQQIQEKLSSAEKAARKAQTKQKEAEYALEKAQEIFDRQINDKEKEEKILQNSEAVRFRVYFEQLQQSFDDAVRAFRAVSAQDAEMGQKLGRALLAVANNMIEQVGEP